MGARSRKRRRSAPGQGGVRTEARTRPDRAAPQPRQPRVRGEARNAQIRAGIAPLAPGERPPTLVVAVAVAIALAVANLVLLATGYHLPGNEGGGPGGVIVFTFIMAVAAAGMWTGRYWAVLGFQCLLALICVAAGLGILVASNLAAAVLCVVVIGMTGTLFYKLIRVLARLQAPQRPGSA